MIQKILANKNISRIENTGVTLLSSKKTKISSLLAGIYPLIDKLKALYLFEGANAQSVLINSLKPDLSFGNFENIIVGNPTLPVNGGIIPSMGNYIISGFNPDGGGLTYLTGASFGFYAPNGLASNEYTIGLYPKFYFGNLLDGAILKGYFAIGGAYVEIPSKLDAGFYMFVREPNSNVIKAYHNGIQYFSNNNSPYLGSYSTPNANINPVIGGMVELAPAVTYYPSTSKIQNVIFGKGLVQSEVTIINNLIQSYNA